MQSLIDQARNSGQQTSGILYLTPRREDSVSATAIPLKNASGTVLAVLTVAISRGGMVAEQQHIRAIAYGVASGGILLGDRLQPVDCGARVTANRGVGARGRRSCERQLGHAGTGARAR